MSTPERRPADEQVNTATPDSFLNADGSFKDEQKDNTVRFLGTNYATERIIRPTEWNTPDAVKLDEKDVKTTETVSWNLGNKYTVDKGIFSKKQLEVLEADGSFSIK